jgi:nucleoside-diphosphate-sugar epimerase
MDLSTDQAKVFALIRPTSDTSSLPKAVELLEHDGSTENLGDLIAAAAPDICIHAASLVLGDHKPGDITPLITSNVQFGTQLLDGLVRAKCLNLVNIGTSWQHFHNDDNTRTDYAPSSLYAATKQAFESIAAYYADAFGLKLLTLKLSDTYGPNDRRSKLIPALERAIKSGNGPISLTPGEQDFNAIYISDVILAIRVAMARVWSNPPGLMEFFSVRGAETLTVRDFVELYSSLSGNKLEVNFGGRPYRPREVMRAWMGPLLPGWQPEIDLRCGLTRLLANDGTVELDRT